MRICRIYERIMLANTLTNFNNKHSDNRRQSTIHVKRFHWVGTRRILPACVISKFSKVTDILLNLILYIKLRQKSVEIYSYILYGMSFLKKKTIVNEMAEQAKKVAVKYNLRELYIKCDQETVWEKPVAFTTQSYRRRNSSNFNKGASFKTGLYF